jgi:hypothetical protein
MRLKRLTEETGFTMVAAIGALLVITMLSIAAIAAAGGDIHLSRYDQDDKQAYAAAEAGIADYLYHLNSDSNYWTKCTSVPTPNAVNQPFTGTPPPTRKWRDVPSSGSEYSIELLPKSGQSTCSTTDPIGTMIDSDGNFRIRSTGHVKGTNNYRAVIATFRRKGFLDFLYFTDLENQALHYFASSTVGQSATRSTNSGGTPDGGPDLLSWGGDKCEHHYWGSQSNGEGRAEYPSWRGQYWTGSAWSGVFSVTTASICGEITFGDADAVNGPFHSNDSIHTCGTPDFGRAGGSDAIEISNADDASDQDDRAWIPCSGVDPNFRPSLTQHAAELGMPPSNTALGKAAQSAYTFTGPTTLAFNGGNVTVTNANVNGGNPQSMAIPSNGVIYVKNNGCSHPYDPTDTETTGSGCADVRVSGNYSSDVTVGAENDIIVTGSLTRTSGNTTALMGLIANGFVRVWHPVTKSNGTCTGNASNTPTNVTIHAAILSLGGSFTVDNYNCGSPLGTLTVSGAIAQKHRGAVGTGGSSIVTGYVKNYNYNDQLKYRSPPSFLDPVQASWKVIRQAEESPAR